MKTERDIARAIAAGDLPSPTEFHNSAFYSVRFSGTGVAWRASIGEYVFRSPETWLSAEMCARVAGAPVVAEHPNTTTLDGKAFFDSIVGVCVFGFVEGEQLMAIVRVIDKRARAILDAGNFDTSPCVSFEPNQNAELQLSDGDTMLIEDNPALVDHLALISPDQGNAGVWTKPGAAPGVEITEAAND